MTTLDVNNTVNFQAAIGFESINLNDNAVHQLNPPDGTTGATLQFISGTGIEGFPQRKPIARIAEFYKEDDFDSDSFYAFDYMYYNIRGVKNLIQTRIKKAEGVDEDTQVFVQVQYQK